MPLRVFFYLFLTWTRVAVGATASPQWERDVLPILQQYCLGCHGETAQTSGLDLRTVSGILKGGNKGPAIVKGSASDSLLYRRVLDRSMPFGPKKLTDPEVAVLREWIDAGAPATSPEERAAAPTATAGHWSFRPLIRPALPGVRNQAWVRTQVDRFILAALEKKGISPAPPAENHTLLRRLFLDVLGTPPSPEDKDRWLKWTGDSKLIDNLLSRTQYGERWARHWLDVVRYAESNGYERDGTKPNAWRYRDYVIDAFNRDKPFDRFLTEQLAGDELPDANAETEIATTFLRLGTWDDEPADAALDRYDQLDDIVGTTSAAFLGITLRCARCHDHKFEPFKQTDYYRFLAIFEPLKRPQDGRNDLDRLVGTEAELAAYKEATAKADAAVAELKKDQDSLQKAILKRIFENPSSAGGLSWEQHAETVLAFATEAGKRAKKQKELVEKFNQTLALEIQKNASAEERATLAKITTAIDSIDKARPKEPPRAYIWYEDSREAPSTHVLRRGDVTQPGIEVQPGVPDILPKLDLSPRKPLAHSTGRRLWLARWMTDPQNPLVARVIVNRIWQWHFGTGLVASENDFGVMGQRPSNQELLDYLATELIQSGWSIKHIQRLILDSSTFRASSRWDEVAGKIDPENTLLWRWKPRRLEAEAVRDSMLAVSGELNQEMGGPSIYPELPRAVLEGQSRPGDGWGKSDSRQAARRSIYIFSKRSLAVPELDLLDAPDTSSSCEKRDVSTTGPQALAFLNGDFTRQQAQHLAARLARDGGDNRAKQIQRAFELVFARSPGRRELESTLAFLAAQQKQIEVDGSTPPEERADALGLRSLCLVLLNSNEFFYIE
jgi:hypothetical protein